MSELKKCPFCGGEAAYTQILGNYERPHEVYCFTCDGGITEGRSKDGVIHNWNNRPIEDKLNARIQELEARVVELEARTRWHKTSEELPPENGVYLVIASFERIYPQPFCTGYEEAWRRLYERWAYMPESGDK